MAVNYWLIYGGEKSVLGKPLEVFLGEICKLCVCIFAFISGYGTYVSLVRVDNHGIDFRSFERNFEVNAFVYDRRAALFMKDMFLKDQAHCHLLNVENWENPSLWHRMRDSFIRLLAPLL